MPKNLQVIFSKIITWYCFSPDWLIQLLALILKFSLQGDVFDGAHILLGLVLKEAALPRCSQEKMF